MESMWAQQKLNQNQLHFQGPQGADAVPESVQVAYPHFNTYIYEI